MRSVDPATAARHRQVIQLRTAGLTFDQIAERAGYAGRSGAKHAYDAALERWAIEGVEQQRVIQSERLDDLWRRVFGDIVQGDLNLVDTALRIEKRRAELWGLDAPKQHELAGPGGGPLMVDSDVSTTLVARLEALRERQGDLRAVEQGNGQGAYGQGNGQVLNGEISGGE